MANRKFKLMGWTISVTVAALITFIIFLESIRVLLGQWFTENAWWLAIISGLLLLVFIVSGAITIGAMIRNRG